MSRVQKAERAVAAEVTFGEAKDSLYPITHGLCLPPEQLEDLRPWLPSDAGCQQLSGDGVRQEVCLDQDSPVFGPGRQVRACGLGGRRREECRWSVEMGCADRSRYQGPAQAQLCSGAEETAVVLTRSAERSRVTPDPRARVENSKAGGQAGGGITGQAQVPLTVPTLYAHLSSALGTATCLAFL